MARVEKPGWVFRRVLRCNGRPHGKLLAEAVGQQSLPAHLLDCSINRYNLLIQYTNGVPARPYSLPSHEAGRRGEAVMTLHQNPAETLAAVEAPLNYLVPTGERPRAYAYDPPTGVPRATGVHEPHIVPIRNARPIAAAISLDQHGFG